MASASCPVSPRRAAFLYPWTSTGPAVRRASVRTSISRSDRTGHVVYDNPIPHVEAGGCERPLSKTATTNRTPPRLETLLQLSSPATNEIFIIKLRDERLDRKFPKLKWASGREHDIVWISHCLERSTSSYPEDFAATTRLCPEPHLSGCLRPCSRCVLYACSWFEKSGPTHLLEDIGVHNGAPGARTLPTARRSILHPVERAAEILKGRLP